MIVGICGYKGSGKSEVAKYLVERYGFVRFPMAKTLKDMLRTFGLTQAQVDGDEKEVPCDLLGGKTPRWAMQALGTEFGRDCIDKDVWVRVWKHNAPIGKATIVVDDMRFPNEAKMLFDLGAKLWKIEREIVRPTGDVHRSEAYIHLLPAHITFTNDGSSLESLYYFVDSALKHERTYEEDLSIDSRLKQLCDAEPV